MYIDKLVALSHESFSPTARSCSCPFSVTHVEHLTGRSAIVCHTEFFFPKSFFTFAPMVTELRRVLSELVTELRRALSEQV